MTSDPEIKPECPTMAISTAGDYHRAQLRVRELDDAAKDSAEFLERLALLAAIARWEHGKRAPSRAERA